MRFKRVLEFVLRLGNYINGGSTRGGAYGFKIGGLCKLQDVKGARPIEGSRSGRTESLTMLEWLITQCGARDPELLDWAQDFATVEACARL